MEETGFLVKHGRGGVISFLAPGQDKPTRLRASTLGDGFDPEDIRAVIAGERPIPELPQETPAPARRVNLIIDIQERMAQGKGPAYERWAKVYNLKQMAAALQYLRENDLMDYEALAASTEKAVERFHTLSEELRQTEAKQKKTTGLMAATVNYAKTRPVFDGYKAARYSKKYLSEHEAELAAYRAARATMNELLDGAKLPKMADMKKSRQELAGKKKALYAEYRKAQADMRQAVAVKANIDHLLGVTDGRENKAQERQRQAADNRRIAPELWDNLSRSTAGLGSSPTSIFAGLRPAKISECGHTRIACHLAAPPKSPLKTRKTKALLLDLRFSGFL